MLRVMCEDTVTRWHTRARMETYSQAYNEAGVHIGALVYRQGEGSHTYLTDLAYLLNLPAAPVRTSLD